MAIRTVTTWNPPRRPTATESYELMAKRRIAAQLGGTVEELEEALAKAGKHLSMADADMYTRYCIRSRAQTIGRTPR
jgi:hypothetical protein